MKNKYILNWLQTHFRLKSFKNGEALLVCPSCQRDKLYFNIFKKIGYCQYASCPNHITAVTIQRLTNLCGFGPDESLAIGVNYGYREDSLKTPIPVSLPENAEPLLVRREGKLLTIFPTAVSYLGNRGVYPDQIYSFNFHFDGLRIYVPIYHEGKMVQWIGRAAWWFEHEEKKYEYAHGSPVTHFLFNWDNNRKFSHLTLVENTFVSIAYSKNAFLNHITYSSTFGSNLSDIQCHLIGTGKAKTVVVMFDRDATEKAQKAVQKLRGLGIRAGMLSLGRRQPDDYDTSIITIAVAEVHGDLETNRYRGRWAWKITEDGRLDVL